MQLTVDGLSLTAGAFTLKSISLEVREREYFVVMGPTGSGKSLLLKAICGFRRVASGTVRIAGRDVTDLEPRFRRIGYVPQDSGLFPHLDVMRNLTFPLEVAGTRLAEAIRQVEPIAETLHIGHLLGRTTHNLSGGEMQKVALARALARTPALLILDEPISALDEPSRRDISRELLRAQREFGVAAIHVCHNLEEAQTLADRVAILDQGELIQSGALDALSRNPANDTAARLMHVAPQDARGRQGAQHPRSDG